MLLTDILRPLLSHDKKTLRYEITDKTGRGGLRTKTVVIRGYPTVIYSITKPTSEDQEKTRMWLVSPEARQEKILASLHLLSKRIGDRENFKEWIQTDPQRRWLMTRITQIRTSGIRHVKIPQSQKILERFLKDRPDITPRSQRDFPRLLSLIKGNALLNCFKRDKSNRETIIANESDIETGFAIYDALSLPNELGISPETYQIYQEVILLLCNVTDGVSRKDILKQYRQIYHRCLADDRLRRQILPALESAGLITQEPNAGDKRQLLVYCTVPSPISHLEKKKQIDSTLYNYQENRGSNSAVSKSLNKAQFKDICRHCFKIKNYGILETKDGIEQFNSLMAAKGICQDCGKRPAEISIKIS